MKKIVALWAVPRSTSTAFEWMMRQRGDMVCLHEPFGEAWYQGEEPRWPRTGERQNPSDELSPDQFEHPRSGRSRGSNRTSGRSYMGGGRGRTNFRRRGGPRR